MYIYAVRHTRVAVQPDLLYGQSDVPLLPGYQVRAAELKEELPEASDVLIVSSPLSRCTLLLEAAGLPFVTDDRLMELSFGEWELTSWRNSTDPRLRRWMEDFVAYRCPGGESFRDMVNRVRGFLSELTGRGAKQTIVVTHGGVVRCLMHLCNGMPLTETFSYRVDYGSVTRFCAGNTRCAGSKA